MIGEVTEYITEEKSTHLNFAYPQYNLHICNVTDTLLTVEQILSFNIKKGLSILLAIILSFFALLFIHFFQQIIELLLMKLQ